LISMMVVLLTGVEVYHMFEQGASERESHREEPEKKEK
jgi:hypothetical protein